MNTPFDLEGIDIAWCPGCGNFPILMLLKQALDELGIDKQNLVTVSGIGQAAKMPQYFETHMYNGLHGRANPVATAIKAANPNLTVLSIGGDGDMYGEGGNHWTNAIRRNADITNIVHNNMVYGLTKGQASPTTEIGFKTGIQVSGVANEPFNPIAAAISLDAGFVARTFSGAREQALEIIKAAILHKGYALVDIFQPCITYNKTNTNRWFKENTVPLPGDHDPKDKVEAFRQALRNNPYPTGIFYRKEKPTFEENVRNGRLDFTQPLHERQVGLDALQADLDKNI